MLPPVCGVCPGWNEWTRWFPHSRTTPSNSCCNSGSIATAQRAILPPEALGGEAVPAYRGYCVDPTTWDGSDVFLPDGTTLLLAVERVANALREFHLTNVLIRPADEVEHIS